MPLSPELRKLWEAGELEMVNPMEGLIDWIAPRRQEGREMLGEDGCHYVLATYGPAAGYVLREMTGDRWQVKWKARPGDYKHFGLTPTEPALKPEEN